MRHPLKFYADVLWRSIGKTSKRVPISSSQSPLGRRQRRPKISEEPIPLTQPNLSVKNPSSLVIPPTRRSSSLEKTSFVPLNSSPPMEILPPRSLRRRGPITTSSSQPQPITNSNRRKGISENLKNITTSQPNPAPIAQPRRSARLRNITKWLLFACLAAIVMCLYIIYFFIYWT